MNDNFQKFVESLQPNSAKVAKSFQAICQQDYTDCSLVDLEQIILGMKPNSERTITTICYVLGAYARFIGDDRLYHMVLDVDRRSLWAMAKPSAPKKFISHEKFEEIYHDIGMFEELNTLYYQTLFRCVYEGIYNDDMSVVKNLRASDIKKNIVTLHEDNGHVYDLEISEELVESLKKVVDVHAWAKENYFIMFNMNMDGIYPDSCFKVPKDEDNATYAGWADFASILQKVSTEYIGYKISPVQLYVSGLMYRIENKLAENGISLEDAFTAHDQSDVVKDIITKELERCNSAMSVSEFRKMVDGQIDAFAEEM